MHTMGKAKHSLMIAISVWIVSLASWVFYNSPDSHSFDDQRFDQQSTLLLDPILSTTSGVVNARGLVVDDESLQNSGVPWYHSVKEDADSNAQGPQGAGIVQFETAKEDVSALPRLSYPLTELKDPDASKRKSVQGFNPVGLQTQEARSEWQNLERNDEKDDGDNEADDETEADLNAGQLTLGPFENNGKDAGSADDDLMAKEHLGESRMDSVKDCATVEEMGAAAVGRTRTSSLQVRRMIQDYMAEHGAKHVRLLASEQFCSRGFVYGRATEDGLGNDMYKILTAAGLSIMLNRSLIIGEHGSTNPAYLGLTGRVRFPFGDYIQYSDQTFTISELKRLWTIHNCATKYSRPLFIKVDDFQMPTRTRALCEDWTMWQDPIIWFKGTTDSIALQFFLKNRHPAMRLYATLLMGDPSQPNSRANLFGELFRAFISPMPVIEDAVQWALQGSSDPDISLHLRMLNSRSKRALNASCSCVHKVLGKYSYKDRLPVVVVVSDTPAVIGEVENSLKGFAKVLHFDYELFLRSSQNISNAMSASYFKPPEKRTRDWGIMPRWVALVEFFLASRAKHAVVSGANRRVSTTYAQLLAALAAAYSMDEDDGFSDVDFYSSFQYSLLTGGLSDQRGWGHSWRRFGGSLSCVHQTNQCAQTPLFPYAWWDGPWQSPVPRDIQKMLAYGLTITKAGDAIQESLEKSCQSRKAPVETIKLQLPSCQRLKSCL